MVDLRENLFVWSVGAVLYAFIEILWRGYTHWSMVITGGICLLFIYKLADFRFPVLIKAFISMLFVTFTELIVGVLVNVILGLDVWDYSALPVNFLGQICLRYSIFWFFLSIPALFLCKGIRRCFYKSDENSASL